MHSRYHEQSYRVPDLIAHRPHDALVVADDVLWGKIVHPATDEQQLAAALHESAKIGVRVIDRNVRRTLGAIDVGVEIRRFLAVGPGRVLVDHVTVISERIPVRIGAANHVGPSELASRLHWTVDPFLSSRVPRRLVNATDRLHLTGGQAVRVVTAFTLE